MLENVSAVAGWSKLEFLRNLTAAGLFLFCTAEILSYAIREWTRKTKLVDLPVLNLRGRDYAEAENSYIANMAEWMKLGREKVRRLRDQAAWSEVLQNSKGVLLRTYGNNL